MTQIFWGDGTGHKGTLHQMVEVKWLYRFGNPSGASDGTRTRDLRRDRPAL